MRLPIPPPRQGDLKPSKTLEAATRFELVIKVLQTSALPLGYAAMERKTGFEPATLALARRCSTTEPLPHLDTNNTGHPGFEPGRDGVKVRCLTAWRMPIKIIKRAIDGT